MTIHAVFVRLFNDFFFGYRRVVRVYLVLFARIRLKYGVCKHEVCNDESNPWKSCIRRHFVYSRWKISPKTIVSYE